MEERIEEGLIKGSINSLTIKETEEILNQMKKSICKIRGKGIGTGFFCELNIDDGNIPCLMTNYHILDNKFIQANRHISINIGDSRINQRLYIEEKDIIYSSPNNEYDIIIINLKNKKSYINYLKIDDNLFNNKSEKRYESIYILHYPNAQNASVSFGYGIECIDNFDIKHKCNTLPGSSGSPILNLSTNKIIGIHKGCFQRNGENNFNLGTFLKYPLNEIMNKNNKTNEINIEAKINNEDINKSICFIHNIKEMNNEKSEIFINNNKIEFNNYFIPEKEGIYSIKIKFNIFITNCSVMFFNCKNLINIDLSNFETKKVTNMYGMFYNCINLENINLSNIDTKNVNDMYGLFYNCQKLANIDLSDFDTKYVRNMYGFFYNCENLENIII